jgi:hypothetical protein
LPVHKEVALSHARLYPLASRRRKEAPRHLLDRVTRLPLPKLWQVAQLDRPNRRYRAIGFRAAGKQFALFLGSGAAGDK